MGYGCGADACMRMLARLSKQSAKKAPPRGATLALTVLHAPTQREALQIADEALTHAVRNYTSPLFNEPLSSCDDVYIYK